MIPPSTSTTSAHTPTDGPWPLRLWGVLAVLCLVVFLDGLDVSMVGVALPSIGTDLNLSTTALQWVVNGYVLGFGGLLLLGGRTADLLGRRKVFLAALAVFAVASLLGGLVDDGPLMIATRLVKGVAAAFTAPTAMSIITTTFPEGHARNKALSIFAVFGASGYSSGLIFGGLLTGLGWRWTFLMPVPLAIIALIVGWRLVPKDRPAATGGYDLVGAATLTGGMLLAVYTVVTAPENGWTHPLTVGSFLVAAALLAAFVAAERRVAHPLVRLGLLRIGTIVRANLAIMALFGTYLSFQFLMTIYLQSVLHWPPLVMALALAPAGIIVAVGSPFVGKLIDRVGSTPLIVGALVSLTSGYLLFLAVGGSPEPDYLTEMLPSVLLLGVGFMLGFSSIMSQATSGVSDDEQGLASGLVQTSGQIGGAVVLAVVTALVTSGRHTADALEGGGIGQFRPGLILLVIVGAAGVAIAASGLRRRRATPAEATPEPARVLETASR
ncbi:EmrB/QacA subfamily drug resistance transporter [Stackebrandtia albiflava]|uniref:EmrB/QacA subfamily drug resistance transporter n=1 Tax=Stackebrandtia albiflava TaxID=406432 RepID=A0A562V2N6_9ACTN|nr:MFS transporter [Stackebrandtia albiflava]TWJ12156.1 EmrB/QacA subfamily drug resistance transporter [Stackebrandtia albiflava]